MRAVLARNDGKFRYVRSLMRCVALSILFLAAAWPAVAAAQRTGDAVTVVRLTTPGGAAAELRVQDTVTGGLCLDLMIDGSPRPDGGCLAPPARPSADLQPHMV